MGLELTDAELAAAATACRALALQEELRARAIANPCVRAPVIATAERYAALAARLEAARRGQKCVCVAGLPAHTAPGADRTAVAGDP